MSAYLIDELPVIQYPLVNRFYRQESYSAKAGRCDTVFVVRYQHQIVAAVILVSYPQQRYFMRAMVVGESFRGQGVGTLLLRHIQPWLVRLLSQGGHCYCFPFAGLQTFYEQGGFHLCSVTQLPESLQGAYCRYSQHRSLLIMQFA